MLVITMQAKIYEALCSTQETRLDVIIFPGLWQHGELKCRSAVVLFSGYHYRCLPLDESGHTPQ